MTVSLGDAGLVWDGEEHLTISGELHPWRLDPARWAHVLDQVQGLGFEVVSCYVPWSVHEVGPGTFDWSGARDVERLLALVHQRGMKAIVRIGPDGAAELETSGWPRWVIDDPACQALRPNGLPYVLVTSTGHCLAPSYASTTFRAHVRAWYREVVGRLAPLQHPDGPIIGCQVDNELGYHFQPNAFALDHHPDAVAAWRAWSGGRWDTPPADAADQPEERRLSWVAWKEHHRIEVLSTLAGWAREDGMDRVLIVHNDYPRFESPMDLGSLEQSGAVDWSTIDVYSARAGGRFVRDVARLACGSSRLPFLAELGAGWLTLPWLLPHQTFAIDEEVIALRGLLSGARGANVYMLVERDRWYGSPIAADGTLREDRAALYPRLRRLLDGIGWLDLRRRSPALLVENRAETRRIAARDTLAGVVPCFSQLLPIDMRLSTSPDAHTDEVRSWERGFATALTLDHDRAISTSLPDLARYETVVMVCTGAVHPRAWTALTKAAANGVRVVIGPCFPETDQWRQPTSFEHVDGVTVVDDPAAVATLVPSIDIATDHPGIDVNVWEGGGRTIVAAFNADPQPASFTLRVPGQVTLQGLWTPQRLAGDGSIEVEFGEWDAQVWELVR